MSTPIDILLREDGSSWAGAMRIILDFEASTATLLKYRVRKGLRSYLAQRANGVDPIPALTVHTPVGVMVITDVSILRYVRDEIELHYEGKVIDGPGNSI